MTVEPISKEDRLEDRERVLQSYAEEYRNQVWYEANYLLSLCRAKQATLQAAEAKIGELREALKPFAEAAVDVDEKADDRWELWERPEAMNLTVGDLRRARAALSSTADRGDGR